MGEIMTYRGKLIKELTKKELIVALNEMAAYYESRLEGKEGLIRLLRGDYAPSNPR